MKTCACVIVCALSAVAAADVVQLAGGPYQANNGGEFTVIPVSGFCGLVGQPSDLSPTTFQTFCVEATEQFAPGVPLDFVINTGAVQGSVGGFDALDARTAYLYFNFRMGTLLGYDYTPGGRAVSADALQRAIWFIEGEDPGANNAFVALADAAVAPGGEWDGLGIGPVRVLNLSNQERPYAQDQLTLIPAPGALVIVGAAAMARRRRR